MSKCRRDVILYCKRKMSYKEFEIKYDGLCNTRKVTDLDEFMREITAQRPDLFVYVHEKDDTDEEIANIGAILAKPEFEHLPVTIIVDLEYQDKVVKRFYNSRISVQNVLEEGEKDLAKLKGYIDELEMLPHVVVVDSDAEARHYFINKLEDSCTIAEFDSATEAKEHVKDYAADILFMDLHLAGEDGLRTAEDIKNVVTTAEIPVVMMSDKEENGTIADRVERKGFKLIQKSIEPGELQEFIKEITGKRMNARGVKTVLVVDDDVMVLRTLQALLKDECNVIPVNNGEAAIKFCSSHVPDLIILDYEMPNMNGNYVLRKLRMNEKLNRCPIVMLTGNSEKQTVLSCIQAGAQGYLVKPVNPISIRLRVRQYLGGIGE